MLASVVGAVVLDSQDADAASAAIKGDTNVVKTKGTLKYDLVFFEGEEFQTLDISYTAELKDSNGGTQYSALSPSTGTLFNGVSSQITLTAPSNPGKYTLKVTFRETVDDKAAVTTERSVTVTVVQPITLSCVVKNSGDVDLKDYIVYFSVDGKLVQDSKTVVSVAAGSESKITYDWVTESLSSGRHTFKVVPGEENIDNGRNAVFSGGEGEFWSGHSDYALPIALMSVMLVVMLLLMVYVYRKPVKNYGKPKSRR
ncbi:MAG: hypothetical protein LBG62_00845 [Candidatus Methanoplasma sp.]|nr:hypothetical protein [Candidatus Methanoplasma sp.]